MDYAASGVIKPISWRKLFGKFSVEKLKGEYWICLPDGTNLGAVRYNVREDKPELLEEICGFVGPSSVGHPFDIRKPETWQEFPSDEELKRAALAFVNQYGLLQNFNTRERSEENREGVLYESGFVGLCRVQEWIDEIFILRGAFRLIKLLLSLEKSPGREAARRLENELESRFQDFELKGIRQIRFLFESPKLGRLNGDDFLLAENTWKSEVLFHSRLTFKERTPHILAAVQRKDSVMLARLAVAQMAEERLKNALSLAFKNVGDKILPVISTNSLKAELWLFLSESITALRKLAVCENPECGKLFVRSKSGGNENLQRYCKFGNGKSKEHCKNRHAYLIKTGRTEGVKSA